MAHSVQYRPVLRPEHTGARQTMKYYHIPLVQNEKTHTARDWQGAMAKD